MDYKTKASRENVEKSIRTLSEHGFTAEFIQSKKEALEKIKSLIPPGASVMNGASKTLEQIGFVDYLKQGEHGWDNLHDAILNEDNPDKQKLLRRQSTVSDYYLGSVHAVSQTGELVIASNTGSQLAHVVYTSPNLIFIVGTQKIVPDLQSAFDRLEQYVVPLEDERLMGVYHAHTTYSKVLVYRKERANSDRKIHVIFVDDVLGF